MKFMFPGKMNSHRLRTAASSFTCRVRCLCQEDIIFINMLIERKTMNDDSSGQTLQIEMTRVSRGKRAAN